MPEKPYDQDEEDVWWDDIDLFGIVLALGIFALIVLAIAAALGWKV